MHSILIKYTQSQINVIDNLLSSSYDEIYTREDFLQLFYLLDRYMMFDKDKIYAQFDISHTRSLFAKRKGIRVLSGLLNILYEKNIIDYTDFHFNLKDSSKSFTRKYKYTDTFLNLIIEEELSFKSENISSKFYERLQNEHTPIKPHLLEQYDLIKSNRFEINLIAASQWLLNRLISGEITKNQYHIHLRVILSLDDKSGIFCVEDEKTGRVFTNFTCMKRELRKFCTIDNEHLEAYDLKSAQPYLLASDLKIKYEYNDVSIFYSIVTENDLYNHFALCSSTSYTRDESKIEFMRYFYKDNRGTVPYETVMRDQFPNVHKIIQELKRDLANQGSNLAVYLQQKESEIFVGGTIDEISRGVLTVHDSVYFKESLREEMREILKTELNKHNKYNYTIKLSL